MFKSDSLELLYSLLVFQLLVTSSGIIPKALNFAINWTPSIFMVTSEIADREWVCSCWKLSHSALEFSAWEKSYRYQVLSTIGCGTYGQDICLHLTCKRGSMNLLISQLMAAQNVRWPRLHIRETDITNELLAPYINTVGISSILSIKHQWPLHTPSIKIGLEVFWSQ